MTSTRTIEQEAEELESEFVERVQRASPKDARQLLQLVVERAGAHGAQVLFWWINDSSMAEVYGSPWDYIQDRMELAGIVGDSAFDDEEHE